MFYFKDSGEGDGWLENLAHNVSRTFLYCARTCSPSDYVSRYSSRKEDTRETRRLNRLLGNFRNEDGDGSENVTTKIKSRLFQLALNAKCR